MTLTIILFALAFVAAPVAAEPTPAAAPIHFTKLIELLPGEDAIAGFKRGKPEGSTTSAMGFHTTIVSADYVNQADSSKSVRIQMTDGAPTQFVTMAYAALSQFSQESTDGYEKGVQVDGFQGIERFQNDGQEGTLTLVVGSVVVEISTRRLPSEMLRTVWQLVPAKAIQDAKPK